MATRRVELGPTGHTVRENVARYRRALGLTLRDVAERLSEAGRPLAHTSVSDIENGSRRVDVDDLLALAFVLEVNPHALLMPPLDVKDGKPGVATVTGLGEVDGESLWEWADGARPLHNPDEDPRAFTGRTRPVWRRTVDHDAASKQSLRREVADLQLAYHDLAITVGEVATMLKEIVPDGDGQ